MSDTEPDDDEIPEDPDMSDDEAGLEEEADDGDSAS
jgi:hypothetical protein